MSPDQRSRGCVNHRSPNQRSQGNSKFDVPRLEKSREQSIRRPLTRDVGGAVNLKSLTREVRGVEIWGVKLS